VVGTAGCQGGGSGSNANTTSTPTPELPNIQQQTVTKEKPAVTHIYSQVSGQGVYPSYEISFRGGTGGSNPIVGIWEGRGQRWQFNSDGSLALQTTDGSATGRYSVDGNTLVMQISSGGESRRLNYQFRISGSGSNRRLTVGTGSEAVTFAYAGGGGGSTGPENMLEAAELASFAPAQGAGATRETLELSSLATGSGFVVSPDGYIVTNAHVVFGNSDPQQMLLQKAAGTIQQQILRDMQDRYQLSEDRRQKIVEILSSKLISYFQQHGSIQGISTDFNVLNGVAGPGDDVEVRSWPARKEIEGTVVEQVNGEPSWGRDVAILSVNQSNLPTVTLGDSTDLRSGDELFVIGYPGIQIENFFDDRNTALEPTLTTGVVSARRTLNSGIDSIQTDAAINSGNSGGPMFDENGEVVGIATFSPTDYDIEQVQFGLPIEVATDFLNRVNVENTQGEMDQAYEEALDAYWRGDCETTIERMDTVTNLYPDHPYANEYVRDCETGNAPGQNGTSS